MFYLISKDNIVQTAQTTFEVHEDLIWVEAEEAPIGYSSSYKDGQIVFEEIVVHVSDRIMQSKPARDVVFCIGYCAPDKGFINPNKEGGSYNQYSLLIQGSGYALNTFTNSQIVIDNVGTLYNLEEFKGSPISYNAHSDGARWVAVNPINDANIDVSVLTGPENHHISDNLGGITIFNALGQTFVNDIELDLNDPKFFHANTDLTIQVAENSYVILVRYV